MVSALLQLLLNYDIKQDFNLLSGFTLPIGPTGTEYGGIPSQIPGNFLSSEHTVRHCRNMYMPKVFQREDRDTFEANQRRDVLHNAQAVYQDILQRLQPDKVLTGEQLKEIEQIVQAANADIVG